MEDLKDIRSEIDKIDDELARLLRRRLEIVDRVAKVKRERGLPVLDPRREKEIVTRVSAKVGPGFSSEISQLFSTIFGISRTRQTAVSG